LSSWVKSLKRLKIRKYEKLADDLSVLVFFCSVDGLAAAEQILVMPAHHFWHRRHLALRLMDELSNEHFKRSAIR
jgi:hypothetical protein